VADRVERYIKDERGFNGPPVSQPLLQVIEQLSVIASAEPSQFAAVERSFSGLRRFE
jgi:hypothetical protein